MTAETERESENEEEFWESKLRRRVTA